MTTQQLYGFCALFMLVGLALLVGGHVTDTDSHIWAGRIIMGGFGAIVLGTFLRRRDERRKARP